MSLFFVAIWMIFNHVLDDFVLQPVILSKLKQRSYWLQYAPEEKYEYDYIAALIIHALSWTFLVMLPLAVFHGFKVGVVFALCYIANAAIHAYVDDLKANKGKFGLAIDQSIHLLQMEITLYLLTQF